MIKTAMATTTTTAAAAAAHSYWNNILPDIDDLFSTSFELFPPNNNNIHEELSSSSYEVNIYYNKVVHFVLIFI